MPLGSGTHKDGAVYYVDLAITGLSFGCMYAMMAVGLTLVYGLLRILHIAHAAVFALGAYIVVIVANAGDSIALGFLAAIVLTPLFGMAIYRLLYEPLLSYRPDVPMIASVGLLVLMQDAFRILFGEQGITFRHNIYAFKIFDIGGVRINAVQIAIVVCAIIIFAGLHLFTTRTRVGIGWRATVSRPKIATSFGVDAVRVRYLNFAIGSALAALAGGLVGLLDNLVDPGIGYVVSYKALAIIVLGGLGSVRGTLIASLILGVVESYGTIFIGSWLNRDAIAFLALIALLMVRPQGYRSARYMSAYEISVVSVIGLNVVLAVSLNIISGFCGQISLGHGAFYGVGAYAAALDELSLGLMPKMVDLCLDVLVKLKAEGLGLLLVEQNTSLALDVADRIGILSSGQQVFEGTVEEARAANSLFTTFLGNAKVHSQR